MHRQVEKRTLPDRAFLVETDPGFNGHIRKALYNEFGGFWQWVLNPSFDIRLAGKLAAPDSGYRDLGRLANCNPAGPARQGCDGDDVALAGEVRLRACGHVSDFPQHVSERRRKVRQVIWRTGGMRTCGVCLPRDACKRMCDDHAYDGWVFWGLK